MAKQQALRREIKKGQTDKERLRGIHGGAPHSAHDIDRMIHEPLAVNDSLTFNELKHTVRTTDGNLSVHARKLEDAGYVNCSKSFDGRTPKTEYSLTAAGRRALEQYLNHMEALLGKMRKG